jgi:carbamoylphosphate synthase small subunit
MEYFYPMVLVILLQQENMQLEILNNLIKKNLPIFGICLGHQILALALVVKQKK